MKRLLALLLAVLLLPCIALADQFGSVTGGTAGTLSSLDGCIYNATAPTLTTGQQVAAQCDASGNLKALELPADAVNFNNTTLANGTVTNGLFTSGTITNPTSNQVILGPIDTLGAASWEFQLMITSGSGANLTVQQSDTAAANTWVATLGNVLGNTTAPTSSTATNNAAISGPVRGRYIQVISTSATEVLTVNGWLRSSPWAPVVVNSAGICQGGITSLQSALSGNFNCIMSTSKYLPVIPYSIPEVTWFYSTNGTAITTNTTTTLQAAQAAGVRNYLTGISCDNSGTGAATELQILDGAAVIFDGFIGAASATLNDPHWAVTFPIPLRGSAATAMSLKTVTTGASLWCAAQGYAAN